MKNYREMGEVDLKLQLLSGSDIRVDDAVTISPYTIDEIREYGYSEYMGNLQWLSLTVEDFVSSVLDLEKRVMLEVEKSKLKAFDFYVKLGGQEMLDGLISALGMVFKTDDVKLISDGLVAIDFEKLGIVFEGEDGKYYLNEDKLDKVPATELKFVHRDNFDEIVEIVKTQNYLTKPIEKINGSNPADEETKKLMEHMENMRNKVNEKKRLQKEMDGESDNIDISDIISSVTAKSNSVDKFNVWSLTLYQLYDEYARLELIDNYDFSIRAMMAGAEKIDLKHWSSRI
ncbi:hypothetical protein P9294_gp158 [Bacillus phage FADO]|uniref:Uncharacterized protein n=1 Tax=Bacillus phage FADO TaxID=2917160 RepID=A0AAE9GBV5_9CAUD|nr:hypothetical protein P9294_gp158 [Bacillus phage FADO]UNY48873.1 hypothetical protein fado_158 [Bacillus phage FADO]